MKEWNKASIRKGFDRLTQGKDHFLAARFQEFMKLGLEILLEQHGYDPRIHHHSENERNTLGWAVYHDGVEVAAGGQDEGPIEGSVLYRLEEVGYSTKGWVGFLMSEMAFDWYRVDLEMDFLMASKDELHENFSTIFKPLR